MQLRNAQQYNLQIYTVSNDEFCPNVTVNMKGAERNLLRTLNSCQLLNGFLWTFTVPNFFDLERKEWRTQKKINLRHYVKHGWHHTCFYKTHIAQRHYAEIFCTEFHPNRSREVEVTCRNSFMSLGKDLLKPSQVSRSSQVPDVITGTPCTPSFTHIGQQIYTLREKLNSSVRKRKYPVLLMTVVRR